jgi:hypothetical protein
MSPGGKYADVIARVRAELDRSEVSKPARIALHGLLDIGARAVNGSPDKIQDLTEMALLSQIYHADKAIQDVEDRKALAAAMRSETVALIGVSEASHKVTCPFRQTLPGKWGGFYAFRWQLTVIGSVLSFSPHVVGILQAVAAFFK